MYIDFKSDKFSYNTNATVLRQNDRLERKHFVLRRVSEFNGSVYRGLEFNFKDERQKRVEETGNLRYENTRTHTYTHIKNISEAEEE